MSRPGAKHYNGHKPSVWLALALGFFVAMLVVLGARGLRTETPVAVVWPATNQTTALMPRLPEPDMTSFSDPDLGFVARVPVGWRRANLYQQGDVGLSVSFESPSSGSDDQFSDYLLIEFLPDDLASSFDQAPTDRTTMLVSDQRVFRERYELPGYGVGGTKLDLVAWQIIYREPGYSVGIYAVGEPREDSRLERLIIEFAHSLNIEKAPFILS